MRSSREEPRLAGYEEIECLRCGARRVKPTGGLGDAGVCSDCGDLGWEYPADLSDADRTAYRARLRLRFDYPPSS